MKENSLENISKVLFFLSLTFLSIYFYMDKVCFLTPYISYFKYLSVLILILVYIYCFIKSPPVTKVLTLLLNTIGIISYIVSRDIHFFLLILFVTSMKNIKFESVIRYDLCLKVIIMMLVMALYYYDMTDNITIVRSGLERISFGFSHPNTFAFVFSMIILEIFYVFRNRRDKFHYLLLFASIFYLNYFTGSRGSIILLTIFSFFILLSKIKLLRKFMNTKVMRFLSQNSFIIFSVISFIVIIKYREGNEFFKSLDKLVSSRINLSSSFFDKYSINLFGNNLPIIGSDEARLLKTKLMVIDNTYIYFILRFGIVSFISFSSMFFFSIWNSFKTKNKMYIIIIFSLIIYGLVETYTYKVPFNTFLFLFGEIIYSSKKQNKENKKTIYVSKSNDGIIYINDRNIDEYKRGEEKYEAKYKKSNKYY